MPERDPLPVLVSVYNQEGELKEEAVVKDKHGIIILAEGSTIPAKMKRRMQIGMVSLFFFHYKIQYY